MMLQALMAYAEREGFDPDFESVPVRWRIPLDANGKWLRSVIPLLADSTAKRPSPKLLLRPFSRSDDVGHGRAYFLCDNLERALAFPVPDNPEKTKSRKINYAFFKGLLREAAEACPDEADRLRAALSFLDDIEELKPVYQSLRDQGCKPTENVDFEVAGDSLLNSTSLQDWWRRRREAERQQMDGIPVMSLASGKMVIPVQTAGKIKGIPGSPPAGANLISQIRGPVQFTFSRSVDPVQPLDLCITRVADVDKPEGEMGRKNLIPYGLYRCHGFISANLAKTPCNFTEDDLAMLFRSLCGRASVKEDFGRNMFMGDESSSHGLMAPRMLVVFKHESALGNAPAHKLFDRITVQLKEKVKEEKQAPRAFNDYDVLIDREQLPKAVELLELLL
jgi:hypothetical protein